MAHYSQPRTIAKGNGMTGLVRCRGRGGEGCEDNALVRPGRTCAACEKPPEPKPKVKKRRAKGIEALIEAANSETVAAERQARRQAGARV